MANEREEFQFPHVHITEVTEQDGVLYEEAVTSPVCDHCFDTRVVWEYTTDRFALDDIGFASDESWLLCDVCAKFVELRQLPALSLRILHAWRALTGMSVSSTEIDKAGQIVQAFFDHLHPGRKAFG